MSRRPRVFRVVLRVALVGVSVAAALAAVVLGRPRLERTIRARIQSAAARRGLAAHVEAVHVGAWPPLRLEGVRVEKPGAWSVASDTVDVSLRLWGRGWLGTRLAFGRATLRGPAGLTLETVPTLWDVVATPEGGDRAELLQPAQGLAATWLPDPEGGRVEGSATDLPAGRLLSVRRDGVPLVDGGSLDGSFRVARFRGATRFDVSLSGRAVRAPGGEPTAVALRFEGSWRPSEGALDVPRWLLTVDGARLSGSLAFTDVRDDARIDLSLEVERVDFALLFRTSGLIQPEPVALRASGAGGEDDRGSASLSARFSGRLADPASFSVSQRIDFTPPQRVPVAIERLRGAFVHHLALPGGTQKAVEVSPASPDFIALGDVPPLFVRTLLLGEDAGFFAHRGIDLSELPSAILTNWARGGAARGASTITQQLAKNLFLSREKRLGRKLQELSLALLLEATLGKERILEIYLNVIEWGPGLHGLRPAARRYFHKEPVELTPGQMAFLVALIPGPVKYQRSFAGGTLSPRFRPLVDDLLAKLRSLDALSEEQYQAALAEELLVDASPEAATSGSPYP